MWVLQKPLLQNWGLSFPCHHWIDCYTWKSLQLGIKSIPAELYFAAKCCGEKEGLERLFQVFFLAAHFAIENTDFIAAFLLCCAPSCAGGRGWLELAAGSLSLSPCRLPLPLSSLAHGKLLLLGLQAGVRKSSGWASQDGVVPGWFSVIARATLVKWTKQTQLGRAVLPLMD